jgi:hypothetical protein
VAWAATVSFADSKLIFIWLVNWANICWHLNTMICKTGHDIQGHTHFSHRECTIWGRLLSVKHISLKSEMSAHLIPGSLSQKYSATLQSAMIILVHSNYKHWAYSSQKLLQCSHLLEKMNAKYVHPSQETSPYTIHVTPVVSLEQDACWHTWREYKKRPWLIWSSNYNQC